MVELIVIDLGFTMVDHVTENDTQDAGVGLLELRESQLASAGVGFGKANVQEYAIQWEREQRAYGLG